MNTFSFITTVQSTAWGLYKVWDEWPGAKGEFKVRRISRNWIVVMEIAATKEELQKGMENPRFNEVIWGPWN